MYYKSVYTPYGLILLEGTPDFLMRLWLPNQIPLDFKENTPPQIHLMVETEKQLHAYFQKKLHTFSLPLSPQGTLFQRTVWTALLSIPYGTTCGYKDVAKTIGNPKAARAVGTANGHNPLPILIPCHRVIPSNGGLGGYSGGTLLKQQFLELEAT